MRLHHLLLLTFILSSCAIFSKRLSDAYPMKAQPDYSCTMGNAESGTFYYLWECYEGKRVLLFNSGAGIFWSSNHQEIGKCGKRTAYELKNQLDIKNKLQCNEKFPYPYQSKGNRSFMTQIVKADKLKNCDFIGSYSSYKDTLKEAIIDLKQKLSFEQVHAFTEPVFDKGIIDKDQWLTKAYVCYEWNKSQR